MNILIILSNPNFGGTETFILTVAPHLKALNHEVRIVNFWKNPLLKLHAAKKDLDYLEFQAGSRYIGFKDLLKLSRLIRGEKYEIILCFGLRVNLAIRFIKPTFGNAVILDCLRGIDGFRKWYHVWPDRLTQSACHFFIPNSQAVTIKRIEREKTAEDKIVVIPNGVDIDFFSRNSFPKVSKSELNLPAQQKILTTIANFKHLKGHFFLLEVIDCLRDLLDNIHFVWAGRELGHFKEELKKRLNSAGCSGKITFLDFLDDVRPLLACSDIFILPSREEGMPRAVMEAMAMSIPCVATNVGGIKELIQHNVNGLISEFGDTQAMADNIRKLLDDHDLYQKISEASRDSIVQNYDIRLIAVRYSRLFELIQLGMKDGYQIQKILDKMTI